MTVTARPANIIAMETLNSLRAGGVLLLAVTVLGCATVRTPPASGSTGAPGSATPAPRPYTEDDVRFMRGMIAHHVQALDMTALVPERAASDDIRRLSERIEVSQTDEIRVMERWLAERGEEVPEGHHHGPLMPGMLTEEEMARLAAASGETFDRLFLESMIDHHEGALVMVADLFERGGGEEAGIYRFASHVDADQRAEIARMRTMLNTTSQEDAE